MANLNRVLLIGNLTRDPEIRYTPKGTAVADIGLAVNRVFTGEDGEKREEVTFVDVVLWSRLAEIANSGMAALDQSWNVRSSARPDTPRPSRLADSEAVDPARLFEASELKDRVADLIGRLPPREQLVVGLHYHENLSQREIAELVGLSPTGIAQIHMRAMQRLRSWMGDTAAVG